MKAKKILIWLFLSLFLCSVLPAVTIPVKNGSVTRFMGLELNKSSGNLFRIVDGEDSILPPIDQDDEQFRTWLSGKTNVSLINFEPFSNDINHKPAEKVFTVLYYFESPGTAFVFFSSKGDLGYQDSSSDQYMNPHMLKSVDGQNFINYNVSCNSTYSYKQKNDAGQYVWTGNFSTASAKNYDSAFKPYDTPINGLEIYDITSPHGENEADPNNPNGNVVVDPIAPKVSSGVVFRRKFNGGGVRGADTYRLNIAPSQTATGEQEMFSAGFYTGYVIFHFTAQ